MIGAELYGAQQQAVLLIPYGQGAAVSDLMDNAEVLSTDYTADGTLMEVRCTADLIEKYRAFVVPDEG